MEKIYWQKIRGISILAVIMIHAIALYQTRFEWDNIHILIILRQSLNFAVPLFIFLSGYFTKVIKSSVLYYKKRISRLLIPYLFWSVIYCLLRNLEFKSIIDAILLGTASWQMYYIIVLFQCVLVAPILFKLNMKKSLILTFILFGLKMFLTYSNNFENINFYFPLCSEYLLFFAGGMYLNRSSYKIEKYINRRFIKSSVIIILVISILEAEFWCAKGNLALTMTQGKISSYLYATSIILLFLSNDKQINNKVFDKFCAKIGDISYAIFYVHMIFIYLSDRILLKLNCDKMFLLNISVVFLFALFGSIILVILLKKIFPSKIMKVLGID